jgi:surface protein
MNCDKLTQLNVANFVTDEVTDMSFMFSGCGNLKELEVSGFNTKKVKNMCGMFQFNTY